MGLYEALLLLPVRHPSLRSSHLLLISTISVSLRLPPGEGGKTETCSASRLANFPLSVQYLRQKSNLFPDVYALSDHRLTHWSDGIERL